MVQFDFYVKYVFKIIRYLHCDKNIQHIKIKHNRFVTTWMLRQIFMYSYKVILAACKITIPPIHPLCTHTFTSTE